MSKTIIAKMSVDAELLIGLLRMVPVGEFISYGTMREAIGRPVAGGTGTLQTARNRLLRDEGIVFDCVRGDGLRRVADVEKLDIAATGIASVNRAVRRKVRILQTVAVEKMEAADVTKFHTVAAHLGTLQAMTTTKATRKISALAESQAKPLAIAEVARSFIESLS